MIKRSVVLIFISWLGVVAVGNAQDFVQLGWNDLGMHCANKYFGKVAVLPPFNNVKAQLILKQSGQPPRVVTSGYIIEYSIPGNTYSVGKTDFWSYAQQLFGLGSPLPPNVGLTGNGLTGTMAISGNSFIATGIPVTPYQDADLVNESPFQLIHLVAKDSVSGTVVATTDCVIPVSNEVGCVQSGCHSSETAILNSHEDASGFNHNGPVLCASCHASNALGTPVVPEAGIFSYSIQSQHASVAGPANSISTCYKCHPGPNTQCLRDIMGKNPTNPLVCQNCHGTMQNVASTIQAGRRPWLDEPQCGNVSCHGSNYAEQPATLFRNSEGHGGLFCSACHGSPHAIQPTVQPNDNVQNIHLQGFAGALKKCSVCHAYAPSGAGPHGLLDTLTTPAAPMLSAPPNGSAGTSTNPTLYWTPVASAQSYTVEISLDSLFTLIAYRESLVIPTSYTVAILDTNQKYYWHVQSVNSFSASTWSETWNFTTTAAGFTISFIVDPRWNLVSVPTIVENGDVSVVFPGALSAGFRFDSLDGYVPENPLSPRTGYWTKFSSGHTASVTGGSIPVDTVDVASGWNLVGGISVPISVSTIVADPPGIIGSKFIGYNSGYMSIQTLLPGHAAWVKLNQSGKLILQSGLLRTKSR